MQTVNSLKRAAQKNRETRIGESGEGDAEDKGLELWAVFIAEQHNQAFHRAMEREAFYALQDASNKLLGAKRAWERWTAEHGGNAAAEVLHCALEMYE